MGDTATSSDRLFHRRGKVVCVAEIKNRSCTKAFIEERGSYLISANKIDDGIALSRLLHVPFWIYAYLGGSDTLASFQIVDAAGMPRTAFTRQMTRTRATCNGGEAVRENCFLRFGDMQVVPVSIRNWTATKVRNALRKSDPLILPVV